MATGEMPFGGASPGVIFDAILNRHPVPAGRLNPALPLELERIIGKCLEKDRDLRYQHASELATDLKRLKRDSDSQRIQPPLCPRPPHPMFRASVGRSWSPRPWPFLRPRRSVCIFPLAHPNSPTQIPSSSPISRTDTGDPVFDATLRQGLAIQLAQSPYLSLVSEERIQRTLRMMLQPADAPLTPEIARAVCERTAAAAVLDGSIASLGSQYVLGLRAKNCRTEEVIDEEQIQAAKKEDVLNALGQMASRFRTRVGESLAAVRKHDVPLADATTPSLEAFKSFTSARRVAGLTNPGAALPSLLRAVEIDPNFATAYAWLGRTYADLGEPLLAIENTRKAWQLRGRVSDQEKFFITFSYYKLVTGDVEKAHQTLELWAQTYPRDGQPHAFLASSSSTSLGKYELVEEEGKKAIALLPERALPSANLARSYICRNQPADAEKTIELAESRKLDSADFWMLRYYMAFLSGDKAGMERSAAGVRQRAVLRDWMPYQESCVLAYSGHFEQAMQILKPAVDATRQAGHRDRAAQYNAGVAVGEFLFGFAPRPAAVRNPCGRLPAIATPSTAQRWRLDCRAIRRMPATSPTTSLRASRKTPRSSSVTFPCFGPSWR